MKQPSILEMSVHTNRQPLGPVKNIHTERSDLYEEEGHWVESLRRPEESFSFDPQRRIVEFLVYNRESSVLMKSIYRYDSAGNLIEKTDFAADDNLVYRTIYTYDSEDTCTLMVYGTKGDLEEKIIRNYDSEGKLLQAISYYADGSLKSRGTQEVDDEGIVTRKRVDYNPDGSVKVSLIRTEDPSGKEYQQYYAANGSLNTEWVSSYNPDRRETERKYYDSKGSFERRDMWNYDPSGELIKTMTYSAQNEIKEDRFFVYEYDQVGNWTKKTHLILVLESELPAYRAGPFIYRTITYWPEQQS